MITSLKWDNTMTANPILLQKKYSRVIECFAKQQGLSLDAALDFFYHSQVYQLIRDGVSGGGTGTGICRESACKEENKVRHNIFDSIPSNIVIWIMVRYRLRYMTNDWKSLLQESCQWGKLWSV